MSVPPDSLLNHLYWLINTPGIGGLSVAAIVLACLGSAAAVLRWIVAGGRADERSTYAYPTAALHRHL